MIRTLLLLLAGATLAGCQAGLSQLDVGDTTRGYLVHVPPGYDGTTPVPLLLALHQFTDTARGMEKLTGFNALADQENFIVVYPQGIRRGWNAGNRGESPDDVAFLEALVAALSQDYAIDPARVYACGISAGGMMAQWLACQSDVLAAFAAVAGSLPETSAEGCAREVPIPALLIHGTEDAVVPFDGGPAGPMGSFLSAPETAAFWAARAGCAETPTETAVDDSAPDDGTSLTILRYDNCVAPVQFYRVEGGGHTWPGRDNRYPRFIVGATSEEFDATTTIWDFFTTDAAGAFR